MLAFVSRASAEYILRYMVSPYNGPAQNMHILAMESSCDDTAVAVLTGNPSTGAFEIMAEKTVSQLIHKRYGGVVPEVAAREHATHIAPLTQEVMYEAHLQKPDVIAVTAGPGLMTSLLVGVETARALSMSWQIPLVPINHIEGHIYSTWLSGEPIVFPALALIVSGGHTELILMRDHGMYELLGKTRDDAAGECFDKIGKIMGLEYPGGPKISALAAQHVGAETGFKLPRPMIDSPDFAFSFAGLKTAALYALRDNPNILHTHKEAFAAEVECAIIEVLVAKTVLAIKSYKPKTVMAGGGVVANKKLVAVMTAALTTLPNEYRTTFVNPQPRYSTDNAAMIAVAGLYYIQKNGLPALDSWKTVNVDPNWRVA